MWSFSESGAIGLESKTWVWIAEKPLPARKWISGIKFNFSHRSSTNKPCPGKEEQAVFIDIKDFSRIEETQRQEMDFIAFDLESELIFSQFFAGLSNLTIKKCGRGCLPCDEPKQGKNKEGELQQRFSHKTPCNCNLWPFCHKHISSKSLMESEPGMRKPGTWKASRGITSNLIWRTDAWFPQLKTHLQVLICSVQHTLCSTWSAHLTIPFFEYKPDCLDEHPNNMKTNNKKGSTSLIDTFYWINAWTKQSSSLQLKKSWT